MVMKTSKLSLGGCRGSEASWDFPSYVKRWTWSAGEAAALYPQNLQRAPDLQLRWDQSLLQNATRQDPSCKKWWEDSGLQRQEHGATLLQQDMLTQVIFSGHWKIGEAKVFSPWQDDDVCQLHTQSPGMPGWPLQSLKTGHTPGMQSI